ncbi:MAG: hypothetical protein JO267_13245 [Alphaproteobacteria bacterium]|nr:hypothetical protein [Alphaproteobacteria bacterium]
MTFIPVTPALIQTQKLLNHVDQALPYRSGRAIRDPDVVSFLERLDSENMLLSATENADFRIEFLRRFPEWLQSSRQNRIASLAAFPYVAFCHGTLHAFDAFYSEYRERRFRRFRGEYMYHGAVWRHGYSSKFIEEGPIESGDALVLSLPFTDSGNKHPLMEEVISACNRLNVPVLLDCSYVNIATGIDFDVDQPCIVALAFSLSKTFYGLAPLRIGIRFKREFNDDVVDICNTLGGSNLYSCAVGLACINKFDVDFNQTRYRDKQLGICQSLNVEASDSVIFGLGDAKWKAYNRGGQYNRLCLSGDLEKN